MSCVDFPSVGLVPGVTTFVVGDVTYIWTGVAWESQGVNIPSGGGQIYIDIRDYGAVPDDTTFDNSAPILAAILAAGTEKTVLIYGGFYCSNFTIDAQCKISGGGTIYPISTALDSLPLIEVSASNCNISNLKFDSLNSGVYPLLVLGDNNKISNITAENLTATETTAPSASGVALRGNYNSVTNLTVRNYLNGTAPNGSVPRTIVFEGAPDTGTGIGNTADGVYGFSVNSGLICGPSLNCSLQNFVFDNSEDGAEDIFNAVYNLNCDGFVCKDGVIIGSAQPIVEKAKDSIYSNINIIDSGLSGIASPCERVTFDNITFSAPALDRAGYNFLRTRSENEGKAVEGVTIKNCTIDIPLDYSSIFAFNEGAVNDLLVENNTFTTTLVSDEIKGSAFILHDSGENPRYINNSFIFVNNATPFPSERAFTISLPKDKTRGEWINNRLNTTAQSAFIRVVGAESPEAFITQDDNFAAANFGTPYLQNGRPARQLSGIAPPNAGVWKYGDRIQNTDVDLNPSVGFSFKKYQFFVCTRSGDYAEELEANRPEFRLSVDLSIADVFTQIKEPTIIDPVEGEQISSPSAAITGSPFNASAGVVHTSSDWQASTTDDFTNIIFSSIGNISNLTNIAVTGVPLDEPVYLRVKYNGDNGETSGYGPVRGVNSSDTPTVDDSVGKASSFNLFNTGSVNFIGDSYISGDKSLALIVGASGSMYRTTDLDNFSALSLPNQPASEPNISIDGADDGSRALYSTSQSANYYSANPSAANPTWIETTGIDYFNYTDLICYSACDSTGLNALIIVSRVALDPDVFANYIWYSTNGGVSASLKSVLTLNYGAVNCCTMAKGNSSYCFAGTLGRNNNGGAIFASSDAGVTWTTSELPGMQAGEKVFTVSCTTDGQTVYVGCFGGKMYKSTNAGINFTQINQGITTRQIRGSVVSRDGKMVAFTNQDGDYIRSYDSGATFAYTAGIGQSKLLGLSVNSSDDAMMMLGGTGNVYISEL